LSPADVIGQRINNYEIVSLLGEGGMGSVYLATHPFMGRKAAVKVLRRELVEDRGLVERFMNEARAANAIHHPNIIDIIDVGLLPSGVPYLMMEFLEGDTLARRIQDCGTLEAAEAIDLAVQTAAALGAAHKKGIVHRDLKPENLFLVPDETRPHGVRVKVLDFGIAKLRGELAGNSAKTQNGALMGTPPYMSPEQCRGLIDEIDERTDIYAMGIIIYQMLLGAPPFVSAGWGDVVLMHLTQAPKAPRATNPQIAPALETAVLTALAKKREERYPTMGAMEAALRAAGNLTPLVLGQRPPASFTPLPGSAAAAVPTSTTFKGASGEVADLETVALRRGQRKLATAGVVAVVAAIALVVTFASRSGRPPGSVVVAPIAPASAAPVAAANVPPAPAATPPPTPVAAPVTAPAPEPRAPLPEPRPEPAAATSGHAKHHGAARAARSTTPTAPAASHAVAAPARPADAPAPTPQPPRPKPAAEKW
jgi:eukaryotic-like serine/threonine-protein kinase